MGIRSLIPEGMKRSIRPLLWTLQKKSAYSPNITEPTGKLPLDAASHTFVVAVGPDFDQTKPDAMMTCRLGYCHAFEKLGIPYVIVNIKNLDDVLPSLTNPFCMIFGADYFFLPKRIIKFIKNYPKFVWVDPWFKGSNEFFNWHGLDARVWTWSNKHRQQILDSEPNFVFTATVETGLLFFEEWVKRGVRLLSLPLACDTNLYKPSAPHRPEFKKVRMVFVGGYWKSKGKQLDKYLRPFEDDLIIYGYNKWPFKGYRGQLSREAEPSLYRQALISPSINEPTVRLLHGQINERVFKVLGSGGVTIVDAVPAYRELFSEDELNIPKDESEFVDLGHELLANDSLRLQCSQRGYNAVVSRHTYIHRANLILQQLGIDFGFQNNEDKFT